MRQLRIFLVVCETLSVTKASQLLYMSQPAISKALKELEADIMVSLFDRINGRLYLNEDGKQFRIKALQLLKEFDELRQFASGNEDQAPIRIGVSLTISAKILPQALNYFKKTYPETPIRIYSDNVKQIELKLLAGDIDVAFIEGFETNHSFERERLSTYPLVCVSALTQKWQVSDCLTTEDLLKIPFLLREKGSTLRSVFDEYTHQQGIEIIPMLESINTEVLINATLAGLGMTILPYPLAEALLKENKLKEIPIRGASLSTTNYIVTLSGKKKSPKLNHLIDCFKQYEASDYQ